jgi:hypothetical protein
MWNRKHPLGKGNTMTEAQNRSLKFAYFMLGIALPVAGYFVWLKTDRFRCCSKKSHIDKAHDVTVEDSFPASDPPSSW